MKQSVNERIDTDLFEFEPIKLSVDAMFVVVLFEVYGSVWFVLMSEK